MISCYYCIHHQQQGQRHTCNKSSGKVVYGKIQEKFLVPCLHFKITADEIIKRKQQVENERPLTRRTMQAKKWRNRK